VDFKTSLASRRQNSVEDIVRKKGGQLRYGVLHQRKSEEVWAGALWLIGAESWRTDEKLIVFPVPSCSDWKILTSSVQS
jgi:hypothetical protein